MKALLARWRARRRARALRKGLRARGWKVDSYSDEELALGALRVGPGQSVERVLETLDLLETRMVDRVKSGEPVVAAVDEAIREAGL